METWFLLKSFVCRNSCSFPRRANTGCDLWDAGSSETHISVLRREPRNVEYSSLETEAGGSQAWSQFGQLCKTVSAGVWRIFSWAWHAWDSGASPQCWRVNTEVQLFINLKGSIFFVINYGYFSYLCIYWTKVIISYLTSSFVIFWASFALQLNLSSLF